MKPFKEVLKDQKSYHESPKVNTVHRSSLIVPKIEGFKTYISFLNHFLIKRGYELVNLKITPYTQKGTPLDSKSLEITKPKVYTFNLDNLIESNEISSFEVEFFSSKNLFIPFCAVIVNHLSQNCINSVHSYNRTLNDLRENEKISKISVKEASFEYLNNEKNGTFLVFQRGISSDEINNKNLEFELYKNEVQKPIWKSSLNLTEKNPPMTSNLIRLNELFDDLPLTNCKSSFSLKVKQPKQFFFYGRLLAGLFSKEDNSFSANHSYYDNSSFEEYFENQESFRTFPFFEGNSNDIIIHPVMSPTKGKLLISLNYYSGNNLENIVVVDEEYKDNNKIYHFELNEIIKNFKISNIKTFTVHFIADDEHKAPTRFSIQLSYGSLKGGLNSSINATLSNKSVNFFKKKNYISWIQIVSHGDYNSNTAICFNDAYEKEKQPTKIPITIKKYNSKGLIEEESIFLKPTDAYFVKSSPCENDPFIWITAESKIKGPLNIYTFHTNKKTFHSSGEHNF